LKIWYRSLFNHSRSVIVIKKLTLGSLAALVLGICVFLAIPSHKAEAGLCNPPGNITGGCNHSGVCATYNVGCTVVIETHATCPSDCH
jgi:hypothetical protein